MESVYILLLVMVVGLSTFADTATLSETCLEKNFDVGFMVDSSTTVKRVFDKELEVVKEIVKVFDIRFGFNRAGLVSFSNEATTDMTRGQYSDVKSFNERVSALKFKGGNTYIDRAADKVTEELYSQRDDKSGFGKILFVLSDGKQTEKNYHDVNLKAHVKELKLVGVRIIAITMSKYADRKYLNQLVDDPANDIVYFTDYRGNALEKTVQEAIKTACRVRPQPGATCKEIKKLDFGFLLDASGSIGKNYWPKEPDFVMAVLNEFKPFNLKDGTRAGVIIYSDEKHVDLVIKLDDHNKLEDFNNALRKFKYVPKRQTSIDKALVKAKAELFSETRGDRPGVQNVLILVTDGKQKPKLKHGTLNDYAEPLRKDGVITFAVGIANADEKELEMIAGSPNRLIKLDKMEDLVKAVPFVSSTICTTCEVNVEFVLDSSRTTYKHYDHEKKIVKSLAGKLKFGSSGTKASVIRFSTKSKVDIGFNDVESYRSFVVEVDNLENMRERTNIEKGLVAAEEEFKHPQNRKKIDKKLEKVIVVLSDGIENEGSVADTARRLREDEKFHIVVISLGRPNMKVLTAIAGHKKYIFDVARHVKGSNFDTEMDKIIVGICKKEPST